MLGYYASLLAGVLAGSFLVAVLLSARLQRLISEPIQQLAGVVRIIGEEKDYTVRAEPHGRDEIGQLTEAFNDMVTQIQLRDTALDESRQRFEVAVTGSSDGLWDWNLANDQLYFSPRWKNMLGYEDHELENSPKTVNQLLHPEDTARVFTAIRDYLDKKIATYEVEFRMRHKDGSYRWILSRGAARCGASGKPVRFAGSHTDITQRQEAKAEVARLHKELVDASRQAGMAEVATGVLHNVGNVLNSVNVSATLVCDMVGKSEVASLGKVTQLLQEHREDLGSFITTHPKGKLLPNFLANLSEQLARENAQTLKELQLLVKNIEHIKEVVAMQQSYARLSGVVEDLPPAEMVEDALQINLSALTRHSIRIIKEFQEVPKVAVDKHKVLQILINLMRNAKHAMDAATVKEKCLRIRIVANGPDRVQVTVRDNGVGIKPENLARIFAHGFTTKRDGHGFGLHSGALAAREMGGSLSAHSDGPGTGATFTLELPVARPRRNTPCSEAASSTVGF